MEPRRAWSPFVISMLVLLAGCSGVPGVGTDTESRLDLTVQNDGDQPIAFVLTVTDGDGATLVNESERLDANVGQTFSFTVATPGRHEATVSGDGWAGQLAWNADTCARYDGTIGITTGAVSVASECLEQH